MDRSSGGAPPVRDGVRPRHPADATGAPDRRHSRVATPAVYRRRRLAVLVALLVVVALVVVLLAYVWPGFARPAAEAEPEPTVTVTAASPTPTLEPAERTTSSRFADALPSTVLGLALRSDAETDTWQEADALEAYELVYADGAGATATTVTVVAGQWATDAEAEAAATALLDDAEPTAEGDVTVDGEQAGRYAVVPGPDGTATVTWRNGTAVLQATGPADLVEDVYAAYPL
ncbi:hypothetical protein [Cellulosimicrobium marinum]|uniref:hypothetical protein n=1 Tax=Cellulosimicrobium marinum TaxID=1638992 RepID=UPI001E631230|nr:hypothetical protein [Cellulosimicrobium marinum]MCB7138212.1 hypothetical protein [Cellulosimicrobium marinum]